MELYGIIGAKFAGKDTFARMIGGDFYITHFADKLKIAASYVYNVDTKHLYDPDLKEKPFSTPIDMDSFLPTLRSFLELDIEPCGCIATNPRELMQYLGAQYVRRSQPDYWLRSCMADVRTHLKSLIPDTRYLNESWAVRAAGGKILKVLRIDAPLSGDTHSSEVEMNSIVPDLLIGSVTGKLWLPQLIADLLRVGDFRQAFLYDYRSLNAPPHEDFGKYFYEWKGYTTVEWLAAKTMQSHYYAGSTGLKALS